MCLSYRIADVELMRWQPGSQGLVPAEGDWKVHIYLQPVNPQPSVKDNVKLDITVMAGKIKFVQQHIYW